MNFWTLNCFNRYRTYAHSDSSPKNALKTSLRSATHATDSTCNGCKANSAATNALRHVAAVRTPEQQKQQHRVGGVQQKVRQMRADRTFAKQFRVQHQRQPRQRMPVAACPVVNAQTTLPGVRPVRTWGLDVK